MKPIEDNDVQEPFAVAIARGLLQKGQKMMFVIEQEDGTAATMGTLHSISTKLVSGAHCGYVVSAYTNFEQRFLYTTDRLKRADVRMRKLPGAKQVLALYIPGSSNPRDLGGHHL